MQVIAEKSQKLKNHKKFNELDFLLQNLRLCKSFCHHHHMPVIQQFSCSHGFTRVDDEKKQQILLGFTLEF